MKMSVKSLRIYFVVVGVLGISVIVASLMLIAFFALMSIMIVSTMNPQCNPNLLNIECLSPIGSALLPSLLVKSPKLIRGIIS